MIKNNFGLFFTDALIICFIVYLLIQYSKNINYTKVMFVVYSDNDKTILQDELTHQTITIEETNKSKYSRCKITFNDKGTEQIQDDVIVKLEWLK